MKKLYSLIMAGIVNCISVEAVQKAVIKEPVVDLRIKPTDVAELFNRDMDQETQLLYGEHISILENQGDWVRVEAGEQPDFYGNNKSWGYEKGWIKKGTFHPVEEFPKENCVVKVLWTSFSNEQKTALEPRISFGTKLQIIGEQDAFFQVKLVNEGNAFIHKADVITVSALQQMSEQEKRDLIIYNARLFITSPYSWGGRCFYDKELNEKQRTSVDCSGLADLCYRGAGLIIPRNSKDQYEGSSKLSHGNQLKKGDLIFLARESNPEKISHVMIYNLDDTFIDAEEIHHNKVRKITGTELFGKPLEEIASGEKVRLQIGNEEKWYTFYFGSYFNNNS
jgi:hypothetical protein